MRRKSDASPAQSRLSRSGEAAHRTNLIVWSSTWKRFRRSHFIDSRRPSLGRGDTLIQSTRSICRAQLRLQWISNGRRRRHAANLRQCTSHFHRPTAVPNRNAVVRVGRDRRPRPVDRSSSLILTVDGAILSTTTSGRPGNCRRQLQPARYVYKWFLFTIADIRNWNCRYLQLIADIGN